jgi:hypothetical protein
MKADLSVSLRYPLLKLITKSTFTDSPVTSDIVALTAKPPYLVESSLGKTMEQLLNSCQFSGRLVYEHEHFPILA